jgi:pyruvate dehydrogenase E2 component (dihydrolipoamide acetyltransferase)
MVEAVIPKLDETTEVATVERWLVQEGDGVEQGQAICEVETDKALVQVEAPVAGTLRRQLIPAGTEVPPLTIVALVGDPAEPIPEVDPFARTAGGSQAAAPTAGVRAAAPSAAPTSAGPVASPRARRLAEERDVDLGTVTGTGPGGKITDRDVQRAAAG